MQGRLAKTYRTFTLTDEAWALTTRPEAQTCSRARHAMTYVCFAGVTGWTAPPILAALHDSTALHPVDGVSRSVAVATAGLES